MAASVGDRYNDYRQPITTVDTSNVEVKPGDAVNNAIKVNIVAGGAGGGNSTIVDGVSSSIKATVLDLTNSNPLTVGIVDASGNQVTSFGGGTQYDQGTVAGATDSLTMAGCVRADTAAVAAGVADGDRARCIVDSTGRLWVHVGVVDGTVAATQSGTWNINNISGTVSLPTGAATESSLVKLPLTQGSSTSGQSGPLVQGAVTTAAPTYINGQTSPLSLQTDGSQRVAVTAAIPTGANTIGAVTQASGPWTTNVTQFGGTNVSTGTGAGGAGIPRVTISNDSSLAANQSVNVNQIGGSAVSTAAAGVQKVGITGNTGAAVDAVIGAATAPANQVVTGGVFNSTLPTLTTGQSSAVQLNSRGEQLVQIGDGTTNAAVIAATTALKTDLSSVAGTASVTAAAGVLKVGVVGNANAAFDAANNAAAPANVLAAGFEAATQGTTQPSAATAGNVRRAVISTDGALYVRQGGPVNFTCGADNIAATLTQLTGCAGAGAGLKYYITNIVAQSTTSTGGQWLLRYGTGTNCGTGTTSILPSAATVARLAAAANTGAPTVINFNTPLATAANVQICVIGVATNTTTIQVSGYAAP
jgi:hypothetical protein